MHTKLFVFYALCYGAAFLLSACAPTASAQNVPPTPTLDVKVEVVAPEPEPTPVVCDTPMGNVSIEVTVNPSDRAEVLVKGLQPSENITFVYERESPNGYESLVFTPNDPVAEDGTFWDNSLHITPSEDEMMSPWQVKVVHFQGVSCALIEVPTEDEGPSSQNDPIIQTVNGVTVTAANPRWQGNILYIEVCYDLLNEPDLIIDRAFIEHGDQKVFIDGASLISTKSISEDGKQEQRCDLIFFEQIPPDADLSTFTLTVPNLLNEPYEGEVCEPEYLARFQAVLDTHETEITVGCMLEVLSGGGGMSGVKVEDKPDSMSQEEAESILYSQEIYLEVHAIPGPWVFTLSLNK